MGKNLFFKKNKLKFTDWKVVEDYFKKHKNLCWFANFPIIWCFLNQKDKIIFLEDNKIIFYREKYCRDIRILFDFSDKDSKKLVKKFSSRVDLIGFSFLTKKPNGKDEDSSEMEFISNNEKVSKMQGHQFREIRKNYNRFIKEYPRLKIKIAGKSDKSKLVKFLAEWSKQFRGTADSTAEKEFFQKFLGSKKTPGTIILDDGNIVGFEFHTISSSDSSIGVSLFKKNLKRYKGLGDFIKILQAKKLLEEGVPWTNNGTAGGSLMHFKNKFMEGGFFNKRYSLFVYDNKIEDKQELLRDFWH